MREKWTSQESVRRRQRIEARQNDLASEPFRVNSAAARPGVHLHNNDAVTSESHACFRDEWGEVALASEIPRGSAARWLIALLQIWWSCAAHAGRSAPQARGHVAEDDANPALADLDELLALGLVRCHKPRLGAALHKGRCYSMTSAGTACVARVTAALELALQRSDSVAELKPHWDRFRRELFLGSVLVKRFRRPAANQALILSAFQEQSWCERIDDPLPRSLTIDTRQRLHETIKSLNHGHKSPVLHFGGDGTGLGVRWSLRTE